MRWKARFLGGALLVIFAVAAMGGIVMLLWNALLPVLFAGVHAIDYPQALGVLVLSRILFGGLRGGHGGWHGRHRWGRWQAMTPEEREQFRRARPWGRHAERTE